MKIQILSDVHLDHASLVLPKTDADIVILAGDIAEGAAGVDWAKETFSVPVVYVPGNHEYYNPSLTMSEHLARMKQSAAHSNVHVLDNEIYEFEGTRFIGTTLWSSLHRVSAALCSDEANISVDVLHGAKPDTVSHFDKTIGQALFDKNKAWLRDELIKDFDGNTVVVTHHAPSPKSIHEQWLGHPWNPCFSTNLEELMGDEVHLWVHGHTHNNFDYRVNEKTRVICNPRGYSSCFGGWENNEWELSKIIEL